mgnify:CR=1 FL=1
MPRNPNRDWAWDQFDIENNQGQLDILNDSVLDDSGLSRTKQVEFETQFIDDLYGTDDAQWTGADSDVPTDWGGRRGTDGGALHSQQKGRASYLGIDTTVWGLDIRRVADESIEVGSNEHYLHLTRGQVDWAYYDKDPAYQKAFKEAGYDTDDWKIGTDDKYWNPDERRQAIDAIRAANESIGAKNNEDDPGTPPKGEYNADRIKTASKGDLYINGERQKTLSELYAKGEGRLNVGFTYTRKDEDGNNVEVTVGDKGELSKSAFDPIAGPPTEVVKPDIKISDVKVKVPASLKQWKSLAQPTLGAGGKPK